jgi:hypothetical protein
MQIVAFGEPLPTGSHGPARLGELHEILQNAFDWSGEHLHRFFAFALLPFETAAKRPKFYSWAFVSIVS